MMKLTKERIAKLAMETYELLKSKGIEDYVCIYYGDQRINTYDGFKIEYGMFADEYCEYAPFNNILTISSEGGLLEYYDYYCEMPEELEDLWKSYGLYYECNESWNWSLYPESDDLIVEYFDRGEKPKDPIYVSLGRENGNKKLEIVTKLWYDLGQVTGDIGSCVIGAYMSFELDGERYELSPVTGWQGEYSWAKHVDTIKSVLAGLGATDIDWHCGRLD